MYQNFYNQILILSMTLTKLFLPSMKLLEILTFVTGLIMNE